MLALPSNTWRAASSLILLVGLQAGLKAQPPGRGAVGAGESGSQHATPQDPQPADLSTEAKVDRVAKAVAKWLATEQTSESLLEETVAAVLKDSKVGLQWLGQQLPAALANPTELRSKSLRSLTSQVILEFLRRTQKTEMVFVGQYQDLAVLEPYASDLLFGLLLQTPDWYPLNFRERLVAPLRDLQLRLPTVERVDGIVALIKDPQETIELHQALAAMMAQWGQPEHAKAVLEKLLAATAEGDGEDRVLATLKLADYYNLLRDYKSAARAHRTAQALAKGAGVELRPIAWYSAACVFALNGDKELGMEALQRCARMHASPNLDRSLRIERKLFDHDPEIALLRADERFLAVLKLAFGDTPIDDQAKSGEAKKDGR